MIHGYQLNGYNIILDVHSGGVHVVDELFYDLVMSLTPPLAAQCPTQVLDSLAQRYDRTELTEAYSEVLELYKSGSLFSQDDYDQFKNLMVLSPIKAICLHISHDCNLRCAYCFAGTGDYGNGRKNMPAEVGKKAIDFLIEKSEQRRNLEVDFFGGEPLLNFEVVKEVVEYARSLEKAHNKVFRFTITTNGMLLDDDKIDFINREMSNVVLSIDGRREVNDRVRRRVDKTGCYDAIMPKFKRLVERRGEGQYYVRGTFTKYNLDFANDVLHLNDCGFDQISVEPVVSDPKLPYALTTDDLPAVFAEYERLSKLLLERRRENKGFNFFHFMMDLDQGPCAIKRLRGCGAGNEYVAITPDGDVYPCHQFVGNPEWRMGDVFSGTVDLAMKQQFASSTVYGKEDCRNCWAKFYCSGGCNANSVLYSGDMRKPYKLSCELEKKRVECAIMIKAAQSE
ncbi:MAG: thioether cross-link-forming SCIFF peptide maturase [Angelakisella sp.]